MTEAETPQPSPEPPAKPPGKGDVIALGIGCLVFVIMFIGIVLVGMNDR